MGATETAFAGLVVDVGTFDFTGDGGGTGDAGGIDALAVAECSVTFSKGARGGNDDAADLVDTGAVDAFAEA